MNKYLVIYKIDGEICEPSIETAPAIFNKMDMADCYDISIARLWLINGIEITECLFYGTWHNGKEPPRMEIRAMIPATPEQMKAYDVGYGTDH